MIELTPTKIRGNGATSLKEHVLGVLRHEISTGALGQGVRLVENDLTRRLNVSRTPLREALRQLEAEGLVVVEPHKGARVSRRSRQQLWEHYRVFAALQGLAAELAGPELTPDDLASLRSLQNAMEAPDFGQHPQAAEQNRCFHDVFVERAGSETISDLIDRQSLYLGRLWSLGAHAPGVLALSVQQHRHILDLCEPAQPAALREAVESHLLETGRLLLSHASTVFAI